VSKLSSSSYLNGRWNLSNLPKRPQAIAWSKTYGTKDTHLSINGATTLVPTGVEYEDFIILTDDNRQPIQYSCDRIENRKRTINAKMRSYHVADKLRVSLNWEMIPSRAFNKDPEFGADGKPDAEGLTQYTSDGGAGAEEMRRWYNSNPGSFWMMIAADKYSNMLDENDAPQFDRLSEYNELVEVYFASFELTVVKRGRNTYDFCNVSVTLEEV
jgi:hypothetical protein